MNLTFRTFSTNRTYLHSSKKSENANHYANTPIKYTVILRFLTSVKIAILDEKL